MRWTPGNRGNIQDMRGRGGRAVPLGIGGFVLLLLLSWVTGTDFLSLFQQLPQSETTGTTGDPATTPAEEQLVDFVDAVTNDAQRTWSELLGPRYQSTSVVLFRDAIQSACGLGQSATGPFYCPGDGRVYLDLGFFNELAQRFGAPGDFAQAYVIAHEIGHHVQNVLGLGVGRAAPPGPDSASVAIELQADCFAGVWGHAASRQGNFTAGRVELEPGDAEEGLRAAAAIGDDRLQKMSTGRVMPERFTHGTSEQRVEAFRRGMESGDPRQCG
jgi:predicted metalloprotease